MPELWQGIIIGALLSIPIGLLVNRLSKTFYAASERRSAKAIARHKAENDAFEAQAQRLAQSPAELALYSRGQTLTAIYRVALGLFEAALAVLLKLMSTLSSDPMVAGWGQLPVFFIVGLAGWHFLKGMQFAEEAIRTLRRIRDIISSLPVASASGTQTPATPPPGPSPAP